MPLRIGHSWAHSAINLTKTPTDEIVGKLDSDIYKSEMGRISGAFPAPTFGYLRGSSIGHREKDDDSRINLAESDL